MVHLSSETRDAPLEMLKFHFWWAKHLKKCNLWWEMLIFWHLWLPIPFLCVSRHAYMKSEGVSRLGSPRCRFELCAFVGFLATVFKTVGYRLHIVKLCMPSLFPLLTFSNISLKTIPNYRDSIYFCSQNQGNEKTKPANRQCRPAGTPI